jgi:hypothetical protein
MRISVVLSDARTVECVAHDAMGGEIEGAMFMSDVGGVLAGSTGRGAVLVRGKVVESGELGHGSEIGEIVVAAPGYVASRAIVDANGDCVARLVPASAIVGLIDTQDVPDMPWSSLTVRPIPSGGSALLSDPVTAVAAHEAQPWGSFVELQIVSPTTAAFRIDGLPPGAYRIAVTAQGAAASQGAIHEVGIATEVDVGTVRLYAQRGLVGSIRHGPEPCAKGKSVLKTFVGSFEATIQHGVATFASVPSGLYDVDVTCESPVGHRRIRSGVEVDEDTRKFEVDVAEGAVIRARVVDGAGRPVAGVVVSARESGLSSLVLGRSAAQPVGLEAVSDSNGDAELRGAVEGIRYHVSASADPRWVSMQRVSIHVDPGQADVNATLVVVARPPTVTGTVVAQGSEVPAPGLELHFIPKHEEPIPGGIVLPGFMRGLRVETRWDGQFEARLSEGDWELEAHDWTGAVVAVTASRTFSVPGDTDAALDVRVDLSGTFAASGRVRGADGAPASDVVIVGLSGDLAAIAEDLSATEVLRRGAVLALTDEDGRFEIDGIRSGAKVLAIDSAGQASRPETVRVASETLLLELRRVWTMSFTVPKRLQGDGIGWCVVGRTGPTVNSLWDRGQTTGDRVDVSGLPDGEYSVLARAGEANEVARLDFALPGTTKLRLPFRDPPRLVGRLVKQGEPLADWLVGATGLCFDDGAVVVTDLDGVFTVDAFDPLPDHLLYARPQSPDDRGLRSVGSLPIPSFDADLRTVELGDLELK